MWKAIRFRRTQALVLAALSALVTACAGFTPLYDRALVQATVRVALAEAPAQVSGLTLSSAQASQPGEVLSDVKLAKLVPPDIRRYLGPPVPSTTVDVTVSPGGPSAATGTLMWRQGACEQVTFTAGACPAGDAEVAVSGADARIFHWRPGSRVPVDERVDPPQTGTAHRTMVVTGVYQLRPGSSWFGRQLTGQAGLPDPDTRQPRFDDWLTDEATLSGPRTPAYLPPLKRSWQARANEVDWPLAASRVGVDQILRLGPAVDLFSREPYPVDPNNPDDFSKPAVMAYSGLPGIAADVEHSRQQANLIVPLLMVPLALLAIVVLWLVLGAATGQRRAEVALARLRGRGPAGARALLLGELGPAILAGIPVGVLAAVALSALARRLWLPGDVPAEVGRSLAVAVLGALVIVAAITGLAVRRLAAQPVSALLRVVPTRSSGWAIGVADAIVIAAAAGAVAGFVTGSLSGPIALAAPSLLALAVGLSLAHLIGPVAAAGGRRLLLRGQVTTAVGVLQLARHPAARRVVAVTTVATALLVFSADAFVVGERNRAYRADRETGAALVATVAGADVRGVRAAVAAVDPGGRQLTPVVQVNAPGISGGTTEAVVPDQFARIALFPGAASDQIPWADLSAPAIAPLRVVGTLLSLSVGSGGLTALPGGLTSATNAPLQPAQLELRLVGHDQLSAVVTVADLSVHPSRPHTVRVPIPCRAGCLVTGLGVAIEPFQPWVMGSVTVSALTLSGAAAGTAAHTAVVPLGPADHWRALQDPQKGSVTPQPADTASGLTMAFQDDGAASVMMDHGSLPARIPALVAGALPGGATGRNFEGLGLDGVTRAMTAVHTVPFAPGAPTDTSIVNLDVLERDGAAPESLTQVQVWFARDDPALLARLTARLEASGLQIAGTQTAVAARSTYDRSASGWSLQLALVVGAVALLVAALVLVVLTATSWRPRARDLAGLRMAGVSPAQVTRICLVEQVPLNVLGVVVGTLCGVVGAHFALPTVPFFATPPAVSTLALGAAWGTVLLASLAALVVLGLVGLGTARLLARRSGPARVREAL